MSPELQPGVRFEWRYTVPQRATVPQLYHDTAFCRDMPDVLERICEGEHERCVIDPVPFAAKLAHKSAKAGA